MAQRTPVGAGPRCRSWRILIGLSLVILSMASHGAAPAPQRLSVSDFQLTTFAEKEGAPEKTWAIAQTNDGWLWFGGSAGLTRFDGVEFEKVDVSTPDGRLSNTASILYALPSGGLVVGHMSGGVTILDRGQARRYSSDAIHALGRPYDVVADARGGLWVSFEGGLMRFDGTEWSVIGADWNFPAGPAHELFVDAAGTLWVHGHGVVLRLTPGTKRFEPVAQVPEPSLLLQSPTGSFWYADDEGITCLCQQELMARPNAADASRKSNSHYFDRSGAYWSKHDSRQPTFTVKGVAALGWISQVIEDVDGNIWLADAYGKVHRLRRTIAVKVPFVEDSTADQEKVPTSLAAGKNGEMWMTSFASRSAWSLDQVWRIENDQPRLWDEGEIKSAARIASDRAGSVWLIARRRLWEWNGSRAEQRAELPAAGEFTQVSGLAAGCAGGAWVAVRGAGLLRFDGHGWQPASTIATTLPPAAPTSLACNDAGQLWLGYGDGCVARVDSNGVTTFFDFNNGANIGTVLAISAGRHIAVGGDRGLALLQDGKFVRVTAARLPVLDGITGLVESDEGDVWVTGTRGLVRLRAADLQSAAKAGDVMPAEWFDSGDGFPGPALSAAYFPRSVARDGRGRIWFVGLGGIAYIDPSGLERAPAARLVLKSLTADGRRFDLFGAPDLPKGTRNLEIAYSALSFTHPERQQYRYRLNGVDQDWVEVGSRRHAIYTNLSPGTHRFSVDVTDERGMWTNEPAVLDFEIAPTFLQSSAFKALCVAMAFGVLFVAYRLRIRQLERRHQLLLVERLDERERIARELHDTLLQGTQALIMKVHSASLLSHQGKSVHEVLDKALNEATNAVVEARNGIEGLRTRSEPTEDLAASLVRFGEELMKGADVRFIALVEGQARAVASNASRETYFICREALLNAFHHAHASAIELQIVYSDERFLARVRDDGRGFDEKVLAQPAGNRHWGLPGMNERARALGATLEIFSRPGAGTEIEIRVPGHVAYSETAEPRRVSRFGRLYRSR
jgi:signal transduction histidine kinase/ligand-binding sensor domain-containing protein